MNPLSRFCKPLSFAFLLAFTFLFSFSKNTTAQPAGFTDQLFLGGWNEVAGFKWDANGRMYVWERKGKVWIVENGVKLPSPLLDISDEVGGWRDFGLLGFALDPNFLSNGYFYLLYVVDRHHLLHAGTPQYDPNVNEYFDATIGRITRYKADAATNYTSVVAGSRFILLGEGPGDGPPVLHESHGIGTLVFGDDGTLMATLGDGASYSSVDEGSAAETYFAQAITDGIITPAQNIGAYRCQTLDNYNGKILRLDPLTGEGLPSNPFWNAAQPKSPASRIWARGVRNPYRMTLVPESGSHVASDGNPGVFMLGDVGWGTREEMDVVDGPGLNFGWPKYEGLTYQPGYNNPAYAPAQHERPKVDWRTGTPRGLVNGSVVNVGSATLPGPTFLGNASTGGVWFGQGAFPAGWQNTYFHADYGEGWIRNFRFDANYNPIEVRDFINAAGACVFLNTDPAQSALYYVRWPDQIRQVSFTGTTNHTPVVFASANTASGAAPLTVVFSSQNTYDQDGDPLTYLWDFGDGTTSTQPNPVHTFNPGNANPIGYDVTLTVSDNGGLNGMATLNISLNNSAPVINSTSIDNTDTFDPFTTTPLSLSANVSDANHSQGQLSYEWDLKLFHNNHSHPIQTFNTPTASALLTPIDCYGASYWYQISLTVSDPTGASDFYQKDIFPACPGNGQSIAFSPISDKLITDAPFTISASASSGLPVTFYVKEGPAKVLGNTVTLDGLPGKVVITATQPGDGNFGSALNVDRSFFVSVGGGNACAGAGSISRDVWTGVSGVLVSQIPLGQAPDISDQLTIFEIPVNAMDNYGTRLRGFICPPVTGNYRFWISSDDNGELWLSTDADPANKQLVANVPSWTDSREWNKFPEQQSALISLQAGQLYYVEALQKEGTGGDNLAVGWTLPDNTLERPIPGNHLLPFGGASPNAVFTAAPLTGNAPLSVSFDAGASTDPDGTIVSYDWNFGDGTLATGVTTNHVYNNPGTYSASVVVTDNNGNTDVADQLITVTSTGQQNQTITFAAIANKETVDPPFTISASATSGLPVSFQVISGPATVSGNTVSLTGQEGTVTIRATQSGNAQWNAAPPVDRTFQVSLPAGGGDIDLAMSVTSNPNFLTVFNNISFTFTITNSGTSTASNVRVFLPKPATVVWVGGNEFSVSQGTYDHFGSKVWFLGNLAAGANATITVNWYVLASDPLMAWAEVSAADQTDVDSTPGNGTCCTANEDDEAALTVTVPGQGPQNQSINFVNIPDKETTSPPFILSASATSGLPVAFEIVSGPASIVGNTVTLNGMTGTVTVRATQSGNANWNPAPPVEQTFLVNEPGLLNQTITFGALPDKQTSDPPFMVNATASSGLPVSFSIVSGPASIVGNTITLGGAAGTVIVRASQAGDAQYNPAPDVDQSFQVSLPGGGGGVDLEMTMSASPTTITQWNNISFTATLSNVGSKAANNVKVHFPKPTGVVFVGGNEVAVSKGSYNVFTDQVWTVGSMPIGAVETITVNWFVLQNTPLTGWAEVSEATPDDNDSTPGNGTCCAALEDDEAAFTAGLPGSGPQDQTITFPSIADKETTSAPFTISASATSGLPVSFSIVSGPATISGSTITLDGTTGTVTVRATQGGDANWNPAPAVERSFAVNVPGLLNQTISFPAIANKETIDPPFTISASATSGLPVSFSIVSGPATISGNTVTLDGTAGSVTVKASQAGDAQYNPAPDVLRSFAVNLPGQGGGPDLEVTMTSSSPTLLIWQNITFSITLTNAGGETANNIVLEVPIPQGLAHTSNTPSQGTYDLFFNEWNVGSLAAGQSVTLDMVLFCLQNTTPLPYFVQVSAATPADVDSSPGNNSSGTPSEDDEALITLAPSPNPLRSISGAVFSLNVEQEGTIALLEWISNIDENAVRYDVERSANGFEWEAISTVEVREYDNSLRSYHQADLYPSPKWNFYRIKQMRVDDSYLYSNVVMLEFWEDLLEYKLFPNPANEYVDVSLKGVEGRFVRLLLVDRMGRLVKETEVEAALAAAHRIDLRGVPEGWYVVWIQAAGRKAKALRLVVGKR
ncbi:MAG TPA: PKD domain-containing protein [Bacteroidetes bacterium]|nr:PKD domain-containing protein [Bacteroidota bacterium]